MKEGAPSLPLTLAGDQRSEVERLDPLSHSVVEVTRSRIPHGHHYLPPQVPQLQESATSLRFLGAVKGGAGSLFSVSVWYNGSAEEESPRAAACDHLSIRLPLLLLLGESVGSLGI